MRKASDADTPADRESAILVAACDSGRARLFRIARNEDALAEVATLLNPDARLRESELVSDKRGRGMHPGRSRRAVMGSPDVHRRQSAERFSREVAERISGICQKEHVERIFLLVDPEFLGLLRADLRRKRIKSAVNEIMKNVSRRSAVTIRGYLPKRLWRRRIGAIPA